jgi:hypothetical protein
MKLMCCKSALTVVFAFITLVQATLGLAQAPDTLWTRTYGDRLDSDYAYSVWPTPDAGYIIAGTTKPFGAGDEDVYLMRTDSNGDTLWTRTYGGAGDDQGRSVQRLPGGGYIIGGWTESFDGGYGDFYLIRTDSNGDTLWTRAYGGERSDYGYCVDQTPDGGYIIGGYASSFGAIDADAYLVRTDANGDTLWTRTYGGANHDECQSVRHTLDGGYISVGSTSSFGAGGYDVYLVKTDANGDTLWTKAIGGGSADRGYSVDLTSDGGYIIAGYTGSFGAGASDIYLVRTDADGDTIWTRTYGDSASDVAYSVRQVSGGGYIIAGYTNSFGAGSRDVYLLRTDALGNPLWTRTFGGIQADHGRSVETTGDNGYIVAGDIGHPSTLRADVYLIRIGPDCSGLRAEDPGGAGVLVYRVRPNPFRDRVRIDYRLARRPAGPLMIYSTLGREIRALTVGGRSEGTHRVIWDGKDQTGQPVPSGVYFLRCEARADPGATKLILLR